MGCGVWIVAYTDEAAKPMKIAPRVVSLLKGREAMRMRMRRLCDKEGVVKECAC